jgi:hypothetical protein
MNEILSPLRRILDGHKKEEREEGDQEGSEEKVTGEEGREEGGAEEEAHSERGVHEAHAA